MSSWWIDTVVLHAWGPPRPSLRVQSSTEGEEGELSALFPHPQQLGRGTLAARRQWNSQWPVTQRACDRSQQAGGWKAGPEKANLNSPQHKIDHRHSRCSIYLNSSFMHPAFHRPAFLMSPKNQGLNSIHSALSKRPEKCDRCPQFLVQ